MLGTQPYPVQRKPRLFYGWYIVLASIALNAYISVAFFQGFTVLFLPILNSFGWTRTQISGAFSLRQLESGVFTPVTGILIDKIGARKVIISSVLIAGVGLILVSASQNLWQFYVGFLIASIGVGGASHGLSWIVIIARWFKRKRGLATSFAMMGGAVGGPAVLIVTFLEHGFGWRQTVLGSGLGLLIIGLPLAMVARNKPEDKGLLPDGDAAPPKIAGSVGTVDVVAVPGLTVREAIRTRTFWSLVVIMGAINIAMGGLQVHQIALFEDKGFSTTQAASTIAIAFTVSGVGRLITGMVMDKTDWRFVMAGIITTQVIAFSMLPFVHFYWQAVVFALIQGLAHGAGVPARPILVGSVFGTRHFGSIWGLLNSPIIFAGVIGPIFMGWTFDYYGSYTSAIWTVTALSAAVIPLLFLTARTRVPQATAKA